MNESAILSALDAQIYLRHAGVVVLGILLWVVLVVITSFFVKSPGRWKSLLNQLRFVLFPAVIYFMVAEQFWPHTVAMNERNEPITTYSTTLLVAETVLAGAGVIVGLGLIGGFLTPMNFRKWFGREVPSLLLDVTRYVLIIIAVAVILKVVWGEDVAPLIGALGIGGIVLGLALQEPLGNFFHGLAMLAEQPFGIGDWIQVGEAAWGGWSTSPGGP